MAGKKDEDILNEIEKEDNEPEDDASDGIDQSESDSTGESMDENNKTSDSGMESSDDEPEDINGEGIKTGASDTPDSSDMENTSTDA